ncbi:MAG: Gfo/Idh/MocA family protein [Fimbriimonas sp.]
MPTPTVAIAGLGGFAAQHHAALAFLEREGECHVVATCDPRPETAPAELLARRVKVHADLDTLLANHDVDLVTLPTPIPLHAAQHAAVVKKGAGCYLEKPPTLWWPEYEAMLANERTARVKTQVGFNFVGDPFRVALQKRIREGEFGKLKAATFLAVWPRDLAYYTRNDWAGRLKVGDQWVLDSPIGNAVAHYVQNLLSFAEATEVHEIKARLHRAHPIESFDTAFIEANAGDVELRIAVTHCGVEPAFNHETLYFEGATIHFDDWRTARVEYPEGRIERLESPYGDQFQLLCGNLRHTLRYLRGEEPAPITPLEACAPFVALNTKVHEFEIRDFFPARVGRLASGQIEVKGLLAELAEFAEDPEIRREEWRNRPLPALPDDLRDPPREFSLCPFWFWNDDLDEAEIARQMDDFQAHGVHAFVIHPRVGLPRELGWMSPALLDKVLFAVEQAARRDMWVVLYDEGMYPSGSSCGQVVAEDPRFRCRGLQRRPIQAPGEDEVVRATRDGWEVVDRPIDSVIRGLHYLGEGPEEDEPAAADLLNPEAVACFIRHVYDGYARALGDHLGTTVKGIFTDEPSLLGRPRESGLLPSTRDLDPAGVDYFDLWDETSESRRRYDEAVGARLEAAYYTQLRDWCRRHRIALMGHPERPDDLSALSYFDVPGQDLVWRWVLPGPTALEGPQSTQAKAAASAAYVAGKRRNSNELAGAYGHELTFLEFKWLVDWCAVRGTNLFFPHAFYYSTRGPRRDERPPDVGPNSPWWGDFAPFARYCARLAWLNTASRHRCDVAILDNDGRLPWRAARALFQHQIDFVYLPRGWDHRFRLVITDGKPRSPYDLEYDDFASDGEFIRAVRKRVLPLLEVGQHPDLRVRCVRKRGQDYYLVHNEGESPIDIPLEKPRTKIDLYDLTESAPTNRLTLTPFELAVLR